MTRAQIVFLHLSTALIVLSGGLFAVFKYAMRTDDPFAVVNHPLEAWSLDAHVVVAPLFVFGFGWIFSDHIWPKLVSSRSPRRGSGLAMLILMIPMTFSGYLLQVSAGELLRQAMAIVHWISSGFFAVGYLIHLIAQKTEPISRPQD